MGLLYDLIKSHFGIGSRPVFNRVATTINTTATRFLANDPDRVGVIISNVGTSTIYIGLSNSVSTTSGIPLFSGGSITLKWENDFESVTHERWAVASGAASTVYVEEVIGTRGRGETE